MQRHITGGILTISGLSSFNLSRSCECGQAFRWHKAEDGYWGVVSGRAVLLTQQGDTLRIAPCREDDVPFWIDYLDLERDYAEIEKNISAHPKLGVCNSESCGIHVFHQEPFETLISFIISANNNVKRIMGIVERISILAGRAFETDRGIQYAFPTPEALAACTEEQLRACGAGYRASYIKNTAAMVRDGFPLESLRRMPLAAAREMLCTLQGVGPKVADCVLLYSLGHDDAFPLDVWMKRVMRTLFFEGKEPTGTDLKDMADSFGPQAGIVQQYLFHYARTMKIEG